MNHPPNIDEFGNLILLRQALDILAAPEAEQRALYPPEREAGEEMACLFREAWALVRPVFSPSLPADAAAALHGIEAALASAPTRWEQIRPLAVVARAALPGRTAAPNRLRAWDDQIVRARNRLLHRHQA
jgi:hypothetical protein